VKDSVGGWISGEKALDYCPETETFEIAVRYTLMLTDSGYKSLSDIQKVAGI